MSNIEEDIDILEKFNPGDEYTEKIKRAIENVLLERETDKKRIKELEEALLKVKDKNIKLFINSKNSIPVQKVNDEIEKYEYMLAETIHGEIQKYTPGEILLKIDTLKELLEEK